MEDEMEFYRYWRIYNTIIDFYKDREYVVTLLDRGYVVTLLDRGYVVTLFDEFKQMFSPHSSRLISRFELNLIVSNAKDISNQIFVFFRDDGKINVVAVKRNFNKMQTENVHRSIILSEDSRHSMSLQRNVCDNTNSLQSMSSSIHPSSNPSHVFNNKQTNVITHMEHDTGKDEQLEHKPTRGLKNLGNTCFMNCILQYLSHTLPLRDFFVSDKYKNHLKTKGDLCDAFKDVMSELWKSSFAVDSYAPHDLKRRVGIVAPRFSGYNQHDAQEFMRFLLNELHEEINKADVKGRKSPGDNESLQEACDRYLTWENSKISELFSGMLRSEVCCSVCEHRSVVFIPFMDLALPIPRSISSSSRSYSYHSTSYDPPTQPAEKLDTCMQVFTKEETLDEKEGPHCNKCMSMTKSTKELSRSKFTEFLMIHLKRVFRYGVHSKLSTPVEFENKTAHMEQIDIKSYSTRKDEQLIRKPTRGLKNLGNTCFMNCILQCLSHTLPLRDFFISDEYKKHLKTKGDLSYAFKCVMSELWKSSFAVDSYAPRDLKRRVGIVAPRFSDYDQHDAQEFMRFLLNELHEEINKADVKGRKSPGDNESLQEACDKYLTWENSKISELFSGMLRSEVCCSVCEHRSVVFIPFMDLALPIPRSISSSSRSYSYHSTSYNPPTQPAEKLDTCMQVFTKEESLDEKEGPHYNKCMSMTKSTKELSRSKFTEFLVIHLKRVFRCGVHSKLSTPVEFENKTAHMEQIDIKSYSTRKDEQLIRKPTRGLKNLGNTCFMNCILQCLSHTLPLRDFFISDEYKKHLKTKGDLSYAFKDVMSELWKSSFAVDSYAPHDLKRRVGIVAPRFSDYDQHDAQEFMRFLLNELHEEINKADVKGRKSPGDNESLQEACDRYLTWENSLISELFSGMLRSEVCCSVCEHRSVVFIPFMDLALPIPRSKSISSRFYNNYSTSYDPPTEPAVKLDTCMQVFIKEETLDEEERPYCNECNDVIKSTKQLSIPKLSEFLVIQLKRIFRCGVRSKLSTPVEFENKTAHMEHDILTGISQIDIKSYSIRKDEQLIREPTRGLKNLGNTCFMNCILQCLSHTLPLRDFFVSDEYKKHLKTKGDLSYAFKGVMSELWKSSFAVDSYAPRDLKRRVGIVAPRFSDYDQHDAQEFMRFLLNELHEEINKADVKGRKSPGDNESLQEACDRYLTWEDSKISELFSGMLRSEVCCSVCKHRSVVFIPFMDLALPIPRSKSISSRFYNNYPTSYDTVKLDACMQVFIKEETLDEEERPYCNECNDVTKSTKQLSIPKLPEFLVIQLKRFSGYSVRSKLSTPVKFEERWEICDNSGKTHAYSLYGIACHSGSIYGGHYTAYCKYNKQWRCFNDRYVDSENWEDVRCQEAYILFYEKIDND